MSEESLKDFVYDNVVIGETLGTYSYVLTEEMLDTFRKAVEDPEARFPTLGVKHDHNLCRRFC